MSRKRWDFGRADGPAGLFDEIVCDNFAGGGGASLGIERALGRAVDAAINHDPDAVAMHRLNHPHTRHYCESVWTVRPEEIAGGRRVGLAWFSPDCCHFSRARGGRPAQKKIRGLAWVVVRWARRVRPRVIMLENVREFLDWGPLRDDDRPCPDRKGQTFRKWVSTLRNLGYAVEWKALNSADYGAPTRRIRLFLIARCDGEPIRWPEPTHGPGRPLAWRTAGECIDWSNLGHSIFLTAEQARPLGIRRPLAEKTLRRVAMGVRRFVVDNPHPYIVRCDHGGDHFRGQSPGEPLATITGHHGFAAVRPLLGEIDDATLGVPGDPVGPGGPARGGGRAVRGAAPGDAERVGRRGMDPGGDGRGGPVPRPAAARRAAQRVLTPYFSAQFGEAPGQAPRGHAADAPIPTITGRQGAGFPLVVPHLTQYNGRSVGQVAGAPCPTITADVRHTGIVAAHLHQYNGQKGDEARGVDPADPVLTVTPDPRFALVSGFLARFQGDRPDGSTTAGRPADAPAPTATARSTQTMVASAFLGQVGHRDADRPGPPVDGPLNTILAKEHHLAAGVVLKHYGGVTGHVPGRPLGTITAADHHSVAAAAMVHMNHGDKQWGSADAPLRTVLAGANHHGLVRAFLEKYNRGARGMSLADPLLTATSMDRFGLVRVEGEDYAIVDITLRMLTPRELFRCQGFPDDYRIDVPMSVLRRPRKGRPPETITRTLPKSGQVRMVGNSVPPPMSEALVRANFPEECRRREPARPARPRMRRAAQGVA